MRRQADHAQAQGSSGRADVASGHETQVSTRLHTRIGCCADAGCLQRDAIGLEQCARRQRELAGDVEPDLAFLRAQPQQRQIVGAGEVDIAMQAGRADLCSRHDQDRIGRPDVLREIELQGISTQRDPRRCRKARAAVAQHQTLGCKHRSGLPSRGLDRERRTCQAEVAKAVLGRIGLGLQLGDTADGEGIAVADPQAVRDIDPNRATADREIGSLRGRTLLETGTVVEDHLRGALDPQTTAIEQHDLIRERDRATGLDVEIAVDVDPLAEHDIDRVADLQPFERCEAIDPD